MDNNDSKKVGTVAIAESPTKNLVQEQSNTSFAPKKKMSFFERLTGIKSFSSKRNEQFQSQQTTVKSIENGKNEEDLEIPAFLRRNS